MVLRGRGSVEIWRTISSKSDLAGVLFASSSREAAVHEIEYFFGSSVEVSQVNSAATSVLDLLGRIAC